MPWLTELAGGQPPDGAVQVKAATKDALECHHLPVIEPPDHGARREVPCGQHTGDTQAQTATRARQRRMPRDSQTCVTNEPAQNDGLVRVGRAVAEQAGEQKRVASGYARLPRMAATERIESASDVQQRSCARIARRIGSGTPESGKVERGMAPSPRLQVRCDYNHSLNFLM
jgi:hypothetical protein